MILLKVCHPKPDFISKSLAKGKNHIHGQVTSSERLISASTSSKREAAAKASGRKACSKLYTPTTLNATGELKTSTGALESTLSRNRHLHASSTEELPLTELSTLENVYPEDSLLIDRRQVGSISLTSSHNIITSNGYLLYATSGFHGSNFMTVRHCCFYTGEHAGNGPF